MTAEIAIEYVRKRASELGHAERYHIRFRHFVVAPSGNATIEGATAMFLLLEPTAYIRVESETGVFDLTETTSNELQFEHQGTIRLTNYSPSMQHVQMIQVIFKNQQDANTDREIRRG